MRPSASVGRGHERLRTPEAGNRDMARAEKLEMPYAFCLKHQAAERDMLS